MCGTSPSTPQNVQPQGVWRPSGSRVVLEGHPADDRLSLEDVVVHGCHLPGRWWKEGPAQPLLTDLTCAQQSSLLQLGLPPSHLTRFALQEISETLPLGRHPETGTRQQPQPQVEANRSVTELPVHDDVGSGDDVVADDVM